MQSILSLQKPGFNAALFTKFGTRLKYVTWKDKKAFVHLKTVYQAATREEAEANLLKLEETWGEKYGAAVRSWQNNWEECYLL